MDSLVNEGVLVLIRKDGVCKPLRLKKERKVSLDKLSFFPDNALGRPYGSSYEVRGNQLVPKPTAAGVGIELTEEAAGSDNRGLACDGTAQLLTQKDIVQMKAEGYTGQAIVESVVENSKSFAEKTIFAQEKYIRKKESRHVTTVTFLKPSTKLLCEMYYNRAPSKTCHLRLDTIAQILTQVNAHASSKLLLVETCQGLLAGALLERMGGFGNLIQVFYGDSPVRQNTIVHCYNGPRSFLDNFGHLSEQDMVPLMMYPLHKVGTLLEAGVIETSLTVQALLKQKESPDLHLGGDDDIGEEGTTNDVTVDIVTVEGDKQNENKDMSCASIPESSTPTSRDRTSPVPPSKRLKCDAGAEGSSASMEEEVVGTEEEEKEVTGTTETAPTQVSRPITQGADADALMAKDMKRRQRDEQYSKAEELLKLKQMDGLVVACRFHPEPILMTLVHFLAPSRPFVVYCPALEPLVSCFTSLKSANCAFNIQLFETWTRKYQVLPSRTHPEMSMDGQSGYILVGTTVKKQMVT